MLNLWWQRWRNNTLDWRQYQYLAIDLELSSLTVSKGHILSLAWVVVTPPCIPLASAKEMIINSGGALGQSPTIHGLTQRELDQGCALEEAVTALFEQTRSMPNCVWLFHHAGLDLAFLKAACHDLGLAWTIPPVVDTLVLETRALRRAGREPGVEGVSLEKCRARHGLPDYAAHNALEDALATAELFLSCAYGLQGRHELRLSRLL